MALQEAAPEAEVTWDNFGELLLLEYAEHLRLVDVNRALENEIARLRGYDREPMTIPWESLPGYARPEANISKQALEDPSLVPREKAGELEVLSDLLRGPSFAPIHWFLHETPDGEPIIGKRARTAFVTVRSSSGRIVQLNGGGETTGKETNGVEGKIVHAETYDTEFRGSGFLKIAATGLFLRREYGVGGLINRENYRANIGIQFLP